MAAGRDLQSIIRRLENAVRDAVRQQFSDAGVFSFGAVEIDPRHLAVWIRTRTDADRDSLLGDPAFLPRMRAILAEVGYPQAAILAVGFTAQSDETVNRDFGGDWWLCVK
ncbi:MAG: hypothetical protein KF723_02340 [Rhizobiaceae bacterium]|nr:hypothetical protein [Rhizobiaceae bacterium]